jgi:hypothetical protein
LADHLFEITQRTLWAGAHAFMNYSSLLYLYCCTVYLHISVYIEYLSNAVLKIFFWAKNFNFIWRFTVIFI